MPTTIPLFSPAGVSLTYLPGGGGPYPAGRYSDGNAYLLRLNMIKDTALQETTASHWMQRNSAKVPVHRKDWGDKCHHENGDTE